MKMAKGYEKTVQKRKKKKESEYIKVLTLLVNEIV